jgi:excisionase family DNA binding protein
MRIDRAITGEVLDRVRPLGIEAALAAMKNQEREHSDKRQQTENAIEQARFEAARAYRQYNAADPENRLVAGDLERRWNDRLIALRNLEEELAELDTLAKPSFSPADRERLLALGEDVSRTWDSPGVNNETRKKIIRLLISEIIVDLTDTSVTAVLHWQGGDHTRLEVKKNKAGQTRWVTDADIVELVRALSRQMPDTSIAAVLNRSGKSTGRGHGWSRAAVCSLRHQKAIATYRDGERVERGEATLNEAAKALGISLTTIRHLIEEGLLPATQLCKNASRVRCP